MRRTAHLLCPSTLILAFFWVRWQRSANPQECEEIGHKLSPFLMSALYRPFRAAEVDAARWEAGLGQATRQQQPVAVWLVGPSAAGKSYLTHDVAKGFGIAFLPTDEPNAVLLDGSSFRNWHSGYQAVIQEGRRLHCVWRAAYPAMRSRLRHEKSRLLRRATRDRLNVLIPHTCDYLSECAPLLYFLRRRGYTNHVVMVLGDREIIRKRGLRRARTTGKRYAPEEWNESVSNGLHMIALATGHAELVWTTPHTRWIVKKGQPQDVFRAAAARGIPEPLSQRIVKLDARGVARMWTGVCESLCPSPFERMWHVAFHVVCGHMCCSRGVDVSCWTL